MGDDLTEMNPCECIFNHEMAMRRLLSFLRQSQSACTDTDCLDTVAGLPNPNGGPNETSDFSMMLMMWVVVAGILFLMRPRSLRSQSSGALNKHNDDNDHSSLPPPPPPSAL